MAFDNLSFEEVDDFPGTAAGWTVTAQSALETAMFFPSAAAEFDSAETFEYGWDNDDYIFNFDAPGALIAHQLDTTGPEPFTTVETFEQLWFSNESYVFGGLEYGGVVFSFDGENYEDFEEQWSSNESYKFGFDGVGIDLTALGSETFESGWDSNESYKFGFVGEGVDLTRYPLAGGATVENFEGVDPWPPSTTIT